MMWLPVIAGVWARQPKRSFAVPSPGEKERYHSLSLVKQPYLSRRLRTKFHLKVITGMVQKD